MNNRAFNYNREKLKYRGIIGTGGIGSGKFFLLNGKHTLGREESRSGHFMEVRDYCKQHIILHYVKVLMGPEFRVIPIGKLGGDEIGTNLIKEMSRTGFDMRYIEIERDMPSLFSFCFQYPDGSGGNMTTDNSACAAVDTKYIERAKADIATLGSNGIIMAAAEVPLKSRIRLLELGKEKGLFCTASFTTEEVSLAAFSKALPNLDLIALNLDEAAALGKNAAKSDDHEEIVKGAIQKLQTGNKNIQVSVTTGKTGSWCWDGKRLENYPCIEARVASTAGAGDAFFSGMLCGISLGLTLFESQELATLVAALSVTSPHTIHQGIQRNSLLEFLQNSQKSVSGKIMNLLKED